MGRKKKLQDPKQVKAKIKAYFDSITPDPEKPYEYSYPPTFGHLALALGLLSTVSLWKYADGDYQESDPEISEALKAACLRIEAYHEGRCACDGKPVGSIFVLKNRKWRDRQEVQVDGETSSVTRIELPEKHSKQAKNTDGDA